MLSFNHAFYRLKERLERIYDAQEASAIAHLVLEKSTGLSRLDRIVQKERLLDEEQYRELEEMELRLLNGEPVQYVIGTQWFLGRSFQVNEHVLIPRPETEELVQWVAEDWKGRVNVTILDIGTGTGCIPVSLSLMLPGAKLTGIDISEEAIQVATENARRLGAAGVVFKQLDFLSQDYWQGLEQFDVIVSNPPYIPASEKLTLDRNVRDFEPGLALFVPDVDALLFYRHIGQFAQTNLRPGGAVYCEVHRDYAMATKELFEQIGFSSVALRKDMHGNDRMIKAMH